MLQKLIYATVGVLFINGMIHWIGGFGATTTAEIFMATIVAAMLEPWVSEQMDG